jgi:hypothetical protein
MRVLLWIILLLAANAVCGQAQKKIVFSNPGWGPTQWDWTKEKWDGNEKMYRDMRLAIDKQIKQGANPIELARQYQKQARSWTDSPGQYRWAYAAYEAARKRGFPERDEALKGISMEDIRQALDQAADEEASARNYEYARLRFLAFARVWPESRLAPMGERLLRRNPEDYEVRYWTIQVQSPTTDPDGKVMLSHVNWILKNMPSNPMGHYLLGEAYSRIWMSTWDKNDSDKAIAAYNSYFQRVPQDHRYRKSAERRIKLIHTSQTFWAKRPEIVARHKRAMAERKARREKQTQ